MLLKYNEGRRISLLGFRWMTMMDHYQTLLLDRLCELESSKKNLRASLQFYYNQTKDRQDIKEYYHSLPLHEGNQNLFHPFHQLLKKTHRPLPYFVSKDLYLYPWVDLQLDGSIKNIYSGIHQDPQKLIEKDFEIIQKKYHRFQNLIEFERHKKEVTTQTPCNFLKNKPSFTFDFLITS